VGTCSGADLPRADKNKFYLLRSYGSSAREIWDVTDPAKPSRVTVVVSGLRDTHESWWECDAGIAYLVSGAPNWRAKRMAQIYGLSDPAHPVFIRNFGLPSQQPGARGRRPKICMAPSRPVRKATAPTSRMATPATGCWKLRIAKSDG
jgi:hypothetical protein